MDSGGGMVNRRINCFPLFFCTSIVNIRKACATIKCTVSYNCYTVGNCDICKTTAIFKCTITYTCYTVRNRDALKATATSERIIADACYTIGDRDAFQKCTI